MTAMTFKCFPCDKTILPVFKEIAIKTVVYKGAVVVEWE
jgi:hypothetical protein